MSLKEYLRFAEGSYGHQLSEFNRIKMGIDPGYHQTRCMLCHEYGIIKNGKPIGLMRWCPQRKKPKI